MLRIYLLSLTSLLALGFALTACGGDTCVDTCEGDQIRRCVDGVLGEAEDCSNGMMCMQMDDGMEHCMVMGDDDDSVMNM